MCAVGPLRGMRGGQSGAGEPICGAGVEASCLRSDLPRWRTPCGRLASRRGLLALVNSLKIIREIHQYKARLARE